MLENSVDVAEPFPEPDPEPDPEPEPVPRDPLEVVTSGLI